VQSSPCQFSMAKKLCENYAIQIVNNVTIVELVLFDSVQRSSLLQKYTSHELQDNIYNWIKSYFQHRSHTTTLQGQFFKQKEITASIVRGLTIDPMVELPSL